MYLLYLERNLKLVFVWEYTKTGKSILRPALDQSNCKKAGPALILIECHLIRNILPAAFSVLIDRREVNAEKAKGNIFLH